MTNLRTATVTTNGAKAPIARKAASARVARPTKGLITHAAPSLGFPPGIESFTVPMAAPAPIAPPAPVLSAAQKAAATKRLSGADKAAGAKAAATRAANKAKALGATVATAPRRGWFRRFFGI